MRRAALVAAGVLVMLSVPPVLVVTGLRVLATDSFVRFEYGRDGFPEDRYGFEPDERLELALLGLRSIEPGGDGVDLLRAARLPDGSPAFDSREIRHMEDVRSVFGAALRLQLVVVIVLVALAVGLARVRAWRRVVPAGLLAGAGLTLGVAALAVPVILLGFDSFFEADTWRFSTTDTLIRLYPELFWQHTAQLAAALTVAQAVVLAGVSFAWLRRSSRRDRSEA